MHAVQVEIAGHIAKAVLVEVGDGDGGRLAVYAVGGDRREAAAPVIDQDSDG